MFKRLLWHIRTRWFSRPGPRRYLMQENSHFAGFDIGAKSYGKPLVLFPGKDSTLRVGKFVSIADGVVIMLGGEHRTDLISTYPLDMYFPGWPDIDAHPITKGDVVIGNDVWIGREAFILSGVTIGDGAVIGSRAVVTKNVAPYSIVAGNPARHIRFRFDAEAISELLSMAWWHWPDSVIQEAVPYLLSNNVRELIDFNRKRLNGDAKTGTV
jgi:acetyltransferase-like isoleucine patch superfamily enzyme